MSEQTKLYTDEQLLRLTDAVRTGLRLSDENARTYAKNILSTGKFALFGYGSLIGDPVTGGYVRDFRGRANDLAISAACVECYYRGTQENVHLTSSTIPAVGEHIDGSAQIYWERKPGAITTDDDIEFLSGFLVNYTTRESGPSPDLTATYKFEPVDVMPSAGSGEKPVKAILAAADTERPNYVGPIVGDPYDLNLSKTTENVTWADFAALEAVASGPDYDPATGFGHEIRSTGASYWRFLISNWTKAGIELPDTPHRAVLLMNAVRKAIGQAIEQGNPKFPKEIHDDYARIISLEARPASVAAEKELDQAAFAVPAGLTISQDQAIEMVLAARQKIGARWHNQLDAHFGGADRPDVGPRTGTSSTGSRPAPAA